MGVSSTRVGDHRGSARTVQPLISFFFISLFSLRRARTSQSRIEGRSVVFCLVFFLVCFLSLFFGFIMRCHPCVFWHSRMFFVLVLLFFLCFFPIVNIDILECVFIEYFSILFVWVFCFQFVLGIIMKILESTMSNAAAFPHVYRHPSIRSAYFPNFASPALTSRHTQDTQDANHDTPSLSPSS